MARSYEVHVAADGAHYKSVDDHDDRGVGTHVVRKCNEGVWRSHNDVIPHPSEMVEAGSGSGPKHCPVCEGDVVSRT